MYQPRIKIKRTVATIEAEIDTLLEMGCRFEVMNGTYTTKIIKPWGKLVLSHLDFPNKVFAAHAMVKRDCLETDYGKHIITQQFSKSNYDDNPILDELICPDLLNIDIKGAYASCLFNSGLIREKTYQYLMGLPKECRLPCVGMLARSYVHYKYDEGELLDVSLFRSETAQLFFYLIAEIDIIMREVKFILGKYFVFYWVDGIFFRYDTPKALVQQVESYLMSLGYNYRYEKITDFHYKNVDGDVRTMFYKNGEFKDMSFRSKHAEDGLIAEYLWKRSDTAKKPF